MSTVLYIYMYSNGVTSSRNDYHTLLKIVTVKGFLKAASISQSYARNILAYFFGATL